MTDDGLVVAQLTITKKLLPDGDVIVNCQAEGDPSYLEIVGLLEFVKPAECWGFEEEDDD